ncbi:hypothetical protein MPL3356_110256 [Mesorhizobium plurifarium]|uniref:Uncharacterized protein n=1 Tax=Mesorhizobium plurifarium TaxID=69974 RepID=A0A090DA50_MESPL|nr:hypothetical protein MPL3356_110256 [Mesorhizobium plurifarium]
MEAVKEITGKDVHPLVWGGSL